MSIWEIMDQIFIFDKRNYGKAFKKSVGFLEGCMVFGFWFFVVGFGFGFLFCGW